MRRMGQNRLIGVGASAEPGWHRQQIFCRNTSSAARTSRSRSPAPAATQLPRQLRLGPNLQGSSASLLPPESVPEPAPQKCVVCLDWPPQVRIGIETVGKCSCRTLCRRCAGKLFFNIEHLDILPRCPTCRKTFNSIYSFSNSSN